MVKWILQNKGKAFWMLLCILAIAAVKGRPDLKFFSLRLCGLYPFCSVLLRETRYSEKMVVVFEQLIFPMDGSFGVYVLHSSPRTQNFQ